MLYSAKESKPKLYQMLVFTLFMLYHSYNIVTHIVMGFLWQHMRLFHAQKCSTVKGMAAAAEASPFDSRLPCLLTVLAISAFAPDIFQAELGVLRLGVVSSVYGALCLQRHEPWC